MNLSITINRTPPSSNHYRGMNRGKFFLRREAQLFFDLMKLEVRGQFVNAEEFEVLACIYLGKDQRGDVDNFGKVLLDGLAKCGVFCDKEGIPVSDAYVRRIVLEKDRSWASPRTEIIVKPYVNRPNGGTL